MYAAEHAAEHGEQPAIIMAPSGRTLTFAEYEAGANQVAHVLRDTGLRKGDHVAIFMENHPAMLLAQAGAERTGLYFTPVNSYLSAEEVAYVINDSRSRVVFTSTAKADVAAQLPALCPDVERWIMASSGRTGIAAPFESWDDAVSSQPTDHVLDEQMGAPMMYSSGTTGRPKGILRPMYDIHPSETSIAVLGIAGLWRCREGMVYLSPAPLYHTAPQVSVAIALRMKSTAVVMEHFDPALYLELVDRYGVTHSQVVPTMFSRMLKLPDEVRAAADLSSLEVIIHAAAPCPVPVKEQMIEWFGPILLEYYAATEGNGCTFITSDDWLAHKGSVGRSVLSDIHILDDDGRPCPVGTSGTVWFAGATDFEYFNDPEKTASTRRDGGKTSTVGDVGYLDEDGYLFLTDRKAHMIISGGVNIYPQETENLLVTHPSVLDAAVIGVPNEDLGEEVKAVVQPVDGVVGDDGAGGGIDRVLPRAPGPLQVPAERGLRGRAAPTAHREVVQGGVARAVLGVARHPHRVSDGAVGLPDDLMAWIEEVGGGRVVLADRMPGGGRKEAWFIDLEDSEGAVHVATSCATTVPIPARTKDPWTLHREATVYLALQDGPVPVPRVLGVHPVHQAMLSERVQGGNWFSRITDPAEQESTARDFMTKLGGVARARCGGSGPPLVSCRQLDRRGRRGRARRVGAGAGGAWRDARPGTRLLAALAAAPHPFLRRAAGVGAGGHGSGELHVSRRPGDGGRRLGAGAPGRPHGRHRVAVAAGDAGAIHGLPDAPA